MTTNPKAKVPARPTTDSTTQSHSAVCNAESVRVPEPSTKARAGVGARARIAPESAITQGDPQGQNTGPKNAGKPAISITGIGAGISVPPDLAELDESVESPTRLFSWREVLTNMGGYFTPPVVWSQAAPSLSELASYSRTGEWTDQAGFWRAVGRMWWRLVGLPVTTVCRYTEWICQRPGRFLTLLFLYTLLAHTDFAGWLLPWPSWLP